LKNLKPSSVIRVAETLEEAGKHVGELKKYDLDEKSPVRQEEHKA
jgi:hypothetical protein